MEANEAQWDMQQQQWQQQGEEIVGAGAGCIAQTDENVT